MTPPRAPTSDALAPGTHTLSTDGLSLRYHVAGEGPVCVMHPGGPGSDWEYLRMPLVEKAVTAVYLEPVGTGESSRLDDPTQYVLATYVRCLTALLSHLDAGPVHVLGHSHGGFVALRLALEQPGLLAGLALYDTAAHTSAEWFEAFMANINEFVERNADRPELTDILDALREEAGAETDEQFTDIFRRQLPLYFADFWAREGEFAHLRRARWYAGPEQGADPVPYDVRGDLGSIDIPALVVAGRHDPILGPRWAQELHDGIPGSRLVVLDDSGHFGHLEQPEAFADAVTEFVRTTSQ